MSEPWRWDHPPISLSKVPGPSIPGRLGPSTYDENIHPSLIIGVRLGLGSLGIVGELNSVIHRLVVARR